MLPVQPFVKTGEQLGNSRVCGDPEKIKPDGKQDHVSQTRNQDPFPQAVFANENMCLSVGLDGNDNFF